MLELQAVPNAICHWAPFLQGQVVSIQSNSRSAVVYIVQEGGTHSPRHMNLTQELLFLADCWGIELRPYYLPGVVNIEADALSQSKLVVEWCIRPDIIHALFCWMGHPFLDLFTLDRDRTPAMCSPQIFLITQGDPKASALDALYQPWEFRWGYAFPPPHLILQTLGKLSTSPVAILLIMPWWPDTMWLGKQMPCHLAPLIELPRPSLTQQGTKDIHQLKFAAWILCADTSMLRASSCQSQISLALQPENLIRKPMSLLGPHGRDGVILEPWNIVTCQM